MVELGIMYVIPAALVLLGGALAIVRLRQSEQQIAPGVVPRVLVGLVPLIIAFALAQLEGLWLGLVVITVACACIILARALIPEARITKWHWPSVAIAFVVVPVTIFFLWLGFVV